MLQLLESEAERDPVAQFRLWFKAAQAEPTPLPEGMTLATVGADGRPAARVVLLKSIDDSGLRFFTNYQSRKGEELAHNPNAALLFWWPTLQRQVRAEGTVRKLDRGASDAYHASRPRGSQLGAWASPQSDVVADRAELQRSFERVEQQYEGGAVPRPPHWGGYVLQPSRYEFWQGRDNRMHDRLVYELKGDEWQISRLAP